jgi:hypothetical protein
MPSPGLRAWWLLVATCGFVGFGFAVTTFRDPWPALSQQANLLTGVVFLGVALLGGRSEAAATWWRGGMTVLLMLVCVTYLTVIDGDLDTTGSLFEHLITPLVVLADWVVVGRTRTARWWYPPSWLVLPLLYLIYFVLADVHLYRSFLDPTSGDFGLAVGRFLLALVAAGYLLYGIAKVRRAPVAAPVLTPGEVG